MRKLRIVINSILFTALLPLVTIMYVYAARGAGVLSEYTISFLSPYCFLVDGTNFNVSIKRAANSSVDNYQTTDSQIEHIVFDTWSDSEYGSMFNWDTSSSINVDATQNANIRVFYQDNTKTAYVLGVNLIAARDCAHMFENFSALKTVDFRNFNSVESESHENMFYNCSELTNIYSGENVSTNLSTSFKNMFYNCTNLASVNTSEWRTPNVATTNAMFRNSGVTQVNMNSWDMQKVANFDEMFSGCTYLASVSLDSLIMTTPVSSTMQSMFLNCSALTSLDLSKLNTSNVTNMTSMFSGCTGLTSINLKSLKTANVTTFEDMFYNCSSLRTLDLCDITSDKVTNFARMFAQSGVETLNLAKFDTNSAVNMDQMFYSMPNLTTIEVSNLWTTMNVTSATNMFASTTSIKGKLGTTYDSSKINAEYAHIDLPNTPGYLTACDVSYKGVYLYDEFNTLMEITYVGTKTPYTLPNDDPEYDHFTDKNNRPYQPGQTVDYSIFDGVENVEFTMYVKRYQLSVSNGSNGSGVRRSISYTYKGKTTSVCNSSTSTSTKASIPATAEVNISVSTTSSSYSNPRCELSPSSVSLTTVSQYSSYKFTMPTQAVTITFISNYDDGDWCIASGSKITLADGTQKPIDEVTLEDSLLVFDHEAGEFTTVDVNFIESDGVHEYNVINLVFSDGTVTRIIYEHGFFDLDENKYVYIHEDDCTSFIGHRFVKLNGNQHDVVTLTDAYVTTENVGCFSIVGKYHLDYYTDGLLSMPGGIKGLFNIFDYDENLQFVNMEEELEEFGVFTYDDFSEYMSEETFNLYPIPHLRVALAKGIITEDMMLYLIERYT